MFKCANEHIIYVSNVKSNNDENNDNNNNNNINGVQYSYRCSSVPINKSYMYQMSILLFILSPLAVHSNLLI